MARPHLSQDKNLDEAEPVVDTRGDIQDSMPSVATRHSPTNHDKSDVQVHPRAGNPRSSFAYVEIPIGGITMFVGKETRLAGELEGLRWGSGGRSGITAIW